MIRRVLLPAVSIAVLLTVFAPAGLAQDPAVVNAKTIRVRLDNAKVRVLEATLNPGDKENMHSHPVSVYYVIDGGRIRNHAADGTTSESTLNAGDVVYRDPVTHWAENIGTTTIRLILVELKEKH